MEPLRRAIYGDYCLLAIPEITPAPLYEHQHQLQHIYGGFITSPIHLTLQRFTTTTPHSLSALKQNLQDVISGLLPLQLHAKMIIPLYSEFRQSEIIKWEIEITKKTRDFFARLEEILRLSDCVSQYPTGWTSSLITALEEVSPNGDNTPANLVDAPRPLFSADKILISRINNYRDYLIIDEFSMRTGKWKSLA